MGGLLGRDDGGLGLGPGDGLGRVSLGRAGLENGRLPSGLGVPVLDCFGGAGEGFLVVEVLPLGGGCGARGWPVLWLRSGVGAAEARAVGALAGLGTLGVGAGWVASEPDPG